MALVDVNSAPYDELNKVPGIGKAIIERIFEGRPFRDMKDLRNRVKHIGDKKEKTLPRYICFGSQSTPVAGSRVKAESGRQSSRRPSQRQQSVRSSAPASASRTVDINNASLAELMTLHGIKEVKAKLIIDARPFYSVDDLMGVKYIKKAALDAFRHRVVVGEYRPQQETRVAHGGSSRASSTISTISTTMAASVAQQYVEPPALYDYSDDYGTSEDDNCSGSDNEEVRRVGKIEPDYDEGRGHTGIRPSGEADADFEAYLQQLREQSETAGFAFSEWFEMESRQIPAPVPFSASSPPDSRFPVCYEVESNVREFVQQSNRQPSTELVPSNHRYRVWTPPAPRQQSPAILFASWNVRNVSKNKSVCFLEKIADVIKQFDLVALQEVRDKRVLIKLKNLLDPGWNFIMSDPVGHVGGRQEHYAFLYRKLVIEPTDEWELETTADVDVLRPPFMAHFRSTPSSGLPRPLELTLVNVHVCFGHIRERHREISAIRCMLDALAAHIPSERRNVVVLGDFNVPPIEALGGTQASLAALIRPPLSTTVFGNLYDNIWVDPSALHRPFDGMTVDACGVNRIDWRFYPNTKTPDGSEPRASSVLPEKVAAEKLKCAVELSDHCPVWAALSTAPTEPTWTA